MAIKSGSATYSCSSGDSHSGESASTTPSISYDNSTGKVTIKNLSKTNSWTNQTRSVKVSISIYLYLIY